MKVKIHPKYYKDAKVTCACGNSWTTGSTKPTLNVEICASCHPFFTGKAKLLDTAGRVDRFKARLEQSRKFASLNQKRKLKKEQAALAKAKAEAAAQEAQKADRPKKSSLDKSVQKSSQDKPKSEPDKPKNSLDKPKSDAHVSTAKKGQKTPVVKPGR